MGYCVRILKTDSPLKAKNAPITLNDSKAAITDNPELQFANRAKTSVVWVDAVGDERGRFRLMNGYLVAKNPSNDFIQKMKAIANRLSAKVIGDNGELYE